MAEKQVRRALTDEEKAECGRLYDAWLNFKETEKFAGRHWTQESLSTELGFSQGNLGHYFHGRQAINPTVLSVVSKRFGVTPESISPRLVSILAPVGSQIESLLRDLPHDGAQASLDFIEFQLQRYGPAMSPEKLSHYMSWAAQVRQDLLAMKRRNGDA